MIMYSLVVGIWLGLNFWMMPWHALQVGQARPSTSAACHFLLRTAAVQQAYSAVLHRHRPPAIKAPTAKPVQRNAEPL